MLDFSERQRGVLIQAVPAVANLGVGTLVFGQFLRQEPFSLRLALAGIALWFVIIGAAVALAGERR